MEKGLHILLYGGGEGAVEQQDHHSNTDWNGFAGGGLNYEFDESVTQSVGFTVETGGAYYKNKAEWDHRLYLDLALCSEGTVTSIEEGDVNIFTKLHLRYAYFEDDISSSFEMAPGWNEAVIEEGVSLIFGDTGAVTPSIGLSLFMGSELGVPLFQDSRYGSRAYIRTEF